MKDHEWASCGELGIKPITFELYEIPPSLGQDDGRTYRRYIHLPTGHLYRLVDDRHGPFVYVPRDPKVTIWDKIRRWFEKQI